MSKQLENVFASEYGISDAVCKSLDIMGYHSPTPVQEKAIGNILNNQDLIVKSKTGSGKTAAFGIPIIDTLDIQENLPQALVLTPTRELAIQVCEELANIGRYKMTRCLPIYGKQPLHIQVKQLKQRVHIAVGTPGRIADLIQRGDLKLDAIKYLIIDEADDLLKKGFIDEVEEIINQIPAQRTTLLFSATMPKQIKSICNAYMQNPVRINIESDEEPIEQIQQSYFEIADMWKYDRLESLLQHSQPESCMIFCNTRLEVDFVAEKLQSHGISCAALHGAMDQKYRIKAINHFKEGDVNYLVATDLAARGIHIDSLDLVVNYSIPYDKENYVHRIGRTGRAGEKGEAISFVSDEEEKAWAEIIAFIGYLVPLGSDKIFTENAPKRASNNNAPKDRKKKATQKKHQDIGRVRINAGKKKKIRPGDILGAVSNLAGISSDDIGIIDIQDTCSYIEIHNHKVDTVCTELAKTKVKGKTVTVKKMNK